MEHIAFVERVRKRIPARPPAQYHFESWPFGGRPTGEGFGLLQIPGVDPGKVIDAVMDVDHYAGNLEHVAVCRSIADARFKPPEAVRFYQKLDIPLLGAIHHDLVLHRMGMIDDWLVAAWDINSAETSVLSAKDGYRSDYSQGVWFARPGLLGYAMASAPKRDDVGFLKWKALTTGADAAAGRVVKANLEAMSRWAARR